MRGCRRPSFAPHPSPLPWGEGVRRSTCEFQRYDFVRESFRHNRRGCSLLRSQRILILFVASDFITASQLFSRLAHHQSGKRIVEAIAIHAVNQLDVAHARAPARALREIRNPRHALRATGQNDIRATEHDRFSGQNDRAQSGSARLVHGERGNMIWNTSAKCDLSRNVRTAAGLSRASPNRIIDLIRPHVRTSQTLFRDCGAQISGRPTSQRSAEAANRCAHGAC